jgi:hypothetical protein
MMKNGSNATCIERSTRKRSTRYIDKNGEE